MRRVLFIILAFSLSQVALAQDEAQPNLGRHSWDVFRARNADNPLLTDLIFIDRLSGERSSATVFGDRFTLTDSGVIYFDWEALQVKLAKSDGMIRDHPFIHVTAETRRADWIVSPDKRRIAWTISRRVGDDQLITAAWLADVAGTEIRELLTYGPRDGIVLAPVAFDAAGQALIMEAGSDGSALPSAYKRRAGLFLLAAVAGEAQTRALPGDQSCLCPVGFGAGLMLRLAPNPEHGSLDLEVYRLDGGAVQIIEAVSRGNYRDAGAILISEDGKQAVYALSQIRQFASEDEEIRSVLVQADLENGRQRIASAPLPDLLRPLAFTEENRAVLVALERMDRTIKIDLEDGRMLDIAAATYLGLLGAG